MNHENGNYYAEALEDITIDLGVYLKLIEETLVKEAKLTDEVVLKQEIVYGAYMPGTYVEYSRWNLYDWNVSSNS